MIMTPAHVAVDIATLAATKCYPTPNSPKRGNRHTLPILSSASKGPLNRLVRCSTIGHVDPEDRPGAVRLDQLERTAVGSCDRCAQSQTEA